MEEAIAGDIIGLHDHGTIPESAILSARARSSDSPACRTSRRNCFGIRPCDPLKAKQLHKGLQLAEEGSTQVFFPIEATISAIVGAVGQLQFDVVAYRLKDEYSIEAVSEAVNVPTPRAG